MYRFILAIILLGIHAGCENEKKELPILGERNVTTEVVNGREVTDTLYHSIPAFSLLNQEGERVTLEDVDGKIYVSDFFFTSCPTICPDMKKQLIRIYERFGDEEDFMIVSHTIDPKHDTVEVLKSYAEKLGVSSGNWWFLTGDKSRIYSIAEEGYLVAAQEDPAAPGGYLHSGAFILLDREQRIRGYYDGTKASSVDDLMDDIQLLLEED